MHVRIHWKVVLSAGVLGTSSKPLPKAQTKSACKEINAMNSLLKEVHFCAVFATACCVNISLARDGILMIVFQSRATFSNCLNTCLMRFPWQQPANVSKLHIVGSLKQCEAVKIKLSHQIYFCLVYFDIVGVPCAQIFSIQILRNEVLFLRLDWF